MIELILVMLIMAIASAIVVPSLSGFAAGRTTRYAAKRIVALADYARVMSTAQGRVYRLNFDTNAGTFWVTMRQGANDVAPPNDLGDRYQIPDRATLTVIVDPQPVVSPIATPDLTQEVHAPAVLFGQEVAQSNALLQTIHLAGTYVEFQPGGRADPVLIRLVDRDQTQINLGSMSATEPLHELTAKELQ